MSEADTKLSQAEQATSTMIVEMAGRSQKILDHLRNNALRPDTQKRLDVRIGIEEAAKLLGCSTARIRDAETDGRLPQAEMGGNNKRRGYTVMDLWNMREALKLYPERPNDAPPAILAIQKLQDVEGFSTMFLNYDLLARKWVRYGKLYPFGEALAGVLMTAGALLWLSAPVALFIGTVGAVSVFKAVYIDKRELKCACVGGDSSVPLGFISLTENLMMIFMGIWMPVRAIWF